MVWKKAFIPGRLFGPAIAGGVVLALLATMEGHVPASGVTRVIWLEPNCWPVVLGQTAGQSAQPTSQQVPEARFASAREFLEFLGVGSSELGDLVDDMSWQEHENRVLHRLLYHLARHFDWWDLERWANHSPNWDDVLSRPDEWRGNVVYLEGKALAVEPVDLPPPIAERLGFRRFFRAELLVAHSGDLPNAVSDESTPTVDKNLAGEPGAVLRPSEAKASPPDSGAASPPKVISDRLSSLKAIVFALDVPQAWLRQEKLAERCGVFGLLLKKDSGAAGSPCVYLAAKRIAWFPDTPLGRLGMDVGLFDVFDRPLPGESGQERQSGGRIARLRLGPHNRECFYQLLAAVGRSAPGQLLQEARHELARQGQDRFSVVPLFNDPANQRGRLVLLTGTARDVLRVDVPDRDIQARFGIRHYFQVHLFTEDSQGNPLVVCVRELPPGMPIGSGQNYAELVTVAGFFFNTWAYRRQPDESTPSGQVLWQLAPLIIARDLEWHPRPAEGAGPWITLLATVVFLVVLFALWWGMLQSIRRPRRPAHNVVVPGS